MPKILSSRLSQFPNRRWARLRTLGLKHANREPFKRRLSTLRLEHLASTIHSKRPTPSVTGRHSKTFQAKDGPVGVTGQYSVELPKSDAFNSRGRTIYNVSPQRQWRTPFSTESQCGFNCSPRRPGPENRRRRSCTRIAKLALMERGISIRSICPAYFEKRISPREFLQLHSIEKRSRFTTDQDLFLDCKEADVLRMDQEEEMSCKIFKLKGDFVPLSAPYLPYGETGGFDWSMCGIIDLEFIESVKMADVMFSMFINCDEEEGLI